MSDTPGGGEAGGVTRSQVPTVTHTPIGAHPGTVFKSPSDHLLRTRLDRLESIISQLSQNLLSKYATVTQRWLLSPKHISDSSFALVR